MGACEGEEEEEEVGGATSLLPPPPLSVLAELHLSTDSYLRVCGAAAPPWGSPPPACWTTPRPDSSQVPNRTEPSRAEVSI